MNNINRNSNITREGAGLSRREALRRAAGTGALLSLSSLAAGLGLPVSAEAAEGEIFGRYPNSDTRIVYGKMKMLLFGVIIGSLSLSSCDTPVGQGAGYGAAGGAIIGGIAGGNVRSAAIGAGAGAATGALIGAIVQDSDRDRYYRDPPPGGYPYARPTGEPGIVRSPYYPHSLVDVRNAPPGALVIDPSSGQPFIRP